MIHSKQTHIIKLNIQNRKPKQNANKASKINNKTYRKKKKKKLIVQDLTLECKMIMKSLWNFWKKVFSNEFQWLWEWSSGISSTQSNFFYVNFILLRSNHTLFLVQYGINLHLWVLKKLEIALAEAALAILAFSKTHMCKLISNWPRKTVWLPRYK